MSGIRESGSQEVLMVKGSSCVVFKEKENLAPGVGLGHGKSVEDKYLLITAFYQISVSSNFIFLLLGKP